MDSPQNPPNVSSQYDKEVQDLLKQLKDASCKLQRVKSEREEVNAEVHQWREEMDRRMLLVLHVDERVCDALMELEAAKQKKQGEEAQQRVSESDAETCGSSRGGGEEAETAV
ncbi:uncharacterized protein Hap1MRO34_006990 isoform 2-T2 [Clarias gariepinus]